MPQQQADPQHFDFRRAVTVGLLLVGLALLPGCSWIRQRISSRVEASNRLSEAAEAAKEQGEHARAGQLLEQAARTNPDDVEVRRELAQWLIVEGRPSAAIRQLQSVILRNPDDIAARFELARLQFDRGDRRGADRSARAVLELDPEHIEALLLRAALAQRRKDRDLSRELYHRVLQVDANNPDAKLQLAQVEMDAAHPDRAAPLLRSVCESSRSTAQNKFQARWRLGLAYGREDRWDEAAAALASAIANHPPLAADDWYRVAYAQYQAGQFDKARGSLNHVLQADPGYPAARTMAARIAFTGTPSAGNRFKPIVPASYVPNSASQPVAPRAVP